MSADIGHIAHTIKAFPTEVGSGMRQENTTNHGLKEINLMKLGLNLFYAT
jgi:hypothetical protein